MTEIDEVIYGLRCEYAQQPLGVETRTPRLSWKLQSAERGQRQTAYQVQVAGRPALLDADAPDLWDSGRVASAQSVFVPYAGAPLRSAQRYFWRVRVWDMAGQASAYSAISYWEMGLLEATDWRARWISRPGICMTNPEDAIPPSPMLRKVILLDKAVARATVFFCGLGYAELYLNGRRVGDDVLNPVFTRYDRRTPYVSYDITERMVVGANVLGVMLGNGWYNCQTKTGWGFDHAFWSDYPKLLLQAQITYVDGQAETLLSDDQWTTTDGPIVFDALRNGETYDARRERDGWLTPDYDAAAWKPAAIVAAPGGVLSSQQMPPCKVMQTLRPVAMNEVAPGVWIYDLGQSIAGWTQLRITAPAGTEITLRHGERLLDNGDLDQANISAFIKSGDCQTDRYITRGGGEERWEPRFIYHGFRYIKVTGFPGAPTLDSIQGRVVHTSFDSVGEFACSEPLLNDIQRCTRWSYIGNFVGIPSDCPHREKNGWTGDAQLAAETGLFNYAAAPAYVKWMTDFADEQRPSGQLPAIVPTSGWGYNWGNGPAWDSAYLLIPWYVYLYGGDKRILADHYAGMKRYVTYLTSMATGHLVGFGLGDWCPVSPNTMAPITLTDSGYYYQDCRIVARVARVLGRQHDAVTYDALAEHIRAAINTKFLDPKTGCYADGGQTAQGCALYFGLVPEEAHQHVLARLITAVAEKDGHLDFGILGAKYVLNGLAENGRAEVAYTLATQRTFPGWGYWLAQGATTLWEDWQGRFSRNHIMFGDISAWMFKTLAGIAPDPEFPGFQRFIIHPQPVGNLIWVRAEHETLYGRIGSAWEMTPAQFTLHVTIPVNCQARVFLPATMAERVTEGGLPIRQVTGVEWTGIRGETSELLVTAGKYRFVVAIG